MEFINYVNNKTFSITGDFTQINYNGQSIATIKIYTSSKINCKLETTDYVIKFSKGQLNLYNKQNDLLDTFEFVQFLGNGNSNGIGSNGIGGNGTTNGTTFGSNGITFGNLIGKYELKENYIIQLTDSNVINNGVTEKIIGVINIGDFWTEYTTEMNNKLVISNIPIKFHNKFNGMPISLNLI